MCKNTASEEQNLKKNAGNNGFAVSMARDHVNEGHKLRRADRFCRVSNCRLVFGNAVKSPELPEKSLEKKRSSGFPRSVVNNLSACDRQALALFLKAILTIQSLQLFLYL